MKILFKKILRSFLILYGGLLGLNLYLTSSYPLNKKKMLQNLKKSYPKATISSSAGVLLRGPDWEEGSLLPLAGGSLRQTVLCNEAFEFESYRSDRFGFRNSDSIWDQSAEIALVGDSFAQGFCVPYQESPAGLLDNQSGKVLNLGSSANGPLANLAVIREYLGQVQPKKVVYFYVANDLVLDLNFEKEHSVFLKYLDSGFSQGLKQRQAEIDSILTSYLDNLYQDSRHPILDLFSLKTLSVYGGRLIQGWVLPEPPARTEFMDYDFPEKIDWLFYRKILQATRNEILTWGGKMYFVLIPDARMFTKIPWGIHPRDYDLKMEKLVTNLGINYISGYKLFVKEENPFASFQPLGDGSYGHFNSRGYKKLARWIDESISDSNRQVRSDSL